MSDCSERTWGVIHNAVEQLEKAWRAGSPPPFPNLPPPGELRQRVLVELIKVDQECRWQVSDRKKIEHAAAPETDGQLVRTGPVEERRKHDRLAREHAGGPQLPAESSTFLSDT